MKITILILSVIALMCFMGCAKVKGMGIEYSRFGDQSIESFEYTQTLPDGTVNHVSFGNQKSDSLSEAIKRIPIPQIIP